MRELQLITTVTPCIEESIAPSKQVTIIVASKSHNERIFTQVCSAVSSCNQSNQLFVQKIVGDNATKQNIPSGTVIDTHIVSSVITEFYLNSHLAFQAIHKRVK